MCRLEHYDRQKDPFPKELNNLGSTAYCTCDGVNGFHPRKVGCSVHEQLKLLKKRSINTQVDAQYTDYESNCYRQHMYSVCRYTVEAQAYRLVSDFDRV